LSPLALSSNESSRGLCRGNIVDATWGSNSASFTITAPNNSTLQGTRHRDDQRRCRQRIAGHGHVDRAR
jgi:hypothetical protein